MLHFSSLTSFREKENILEYRLLARLLGALCFEERLRIISALISESDEGLSQRELAEIT